MPTQQELINMINNNTEPKQSSLGFGGSEIYDADTIYKDGQGYRIQGIDTPEMPTAQLKAHRLQEAKKSKTGEYVSLATAGEAAKLEAELMELGPNALSDKLLFEGQRIEFDDTKDEAITGIGSDYTEEGIYGRKLVDAPEYSKDLIERGYALPAFTKVEGTVEAAKKAKKKKLGLWSQYDEEMDQIAQKRNSFQEKRASVNLDGRLLTDIKQAASSGLSTLAGFADSMYDMFADEDSEFLEYWKDNQNTDKLLGTNQKYLIEANKELDNELDKGNYLGAFGSVVSNADVHLAESAGEIGLLAFKLPGLLAAVSNRVNTQAEKYKENTGLDPDGEWYATAIGTNIAVLGAQQLMVFKPLKKILDAMKTGKTGSVKSSVGAVVGSTVGETVQEIADTAQDKYNVGKGAITTDEAIKAGISGAGVAAPLRVGVETVVQAQGVSDKLTEVVKNTEAYKAKDAEITKEKQEQEVTEPTEVNLADEIDVTKEYTKDEIRDVVINMLDPNSKTKYVDNKEKEQFMANNVEVVNEIAKEMSVSTDGAQATSPQGEVKPEVTEVVDIDKEIEVINTDKTLQEPQKQEKVDKVASAIDVQAKELQGALNELVSAKRNTTDEVKLAEIQKEGTTAYKQMTNLMNKYKTLTGEDLVLESPVDTSNINTEPNKPITSMTIGTQEFQIQDIGQNTYRVRGLGNTPIDMITVGGTIAIQKALSKRVGSTITSELADRLNTVNYTRPVIGDSKSRLKFEPRVDKVNTKVKKTIDSIGSIMDNVDKAVQVVKPKYQKATRELLGKIKTSKSLRPGIAKANEILNTGKLPVLDNDNAGDYAKYLVDETGQLPKEIQDVAPIAVLSTYASGIENGSSNYRANAEKDGEIVSEEYASVLDRGVYLADFVAKVGESTLGTVGIQPKWEGIVDNVVKTKKKSSMNTSLGLALTDGLIGEGKLFKIEKVKHPVSGNEVQFVVPNNTSALKQLSKDSLPLAQELGMHTKSRPFIEGEEVSSNFNKGVDGNIPSEKMQQHVKHLESMKFKIKTDLVQKLKGISKENILKMMGWENPEHVQKSRRASVESKNQNLERVYDQNKEFVEQVGNKSFQFTMALKSNMRVFIEQNVFNPVNDKQYARALLKMGEPVKVTKELESNYKRAILLHLSGAKIEKMTDNQVQAELDRVYKEISDQKVNGQQSLVPFFQEEGIAKFDAFIDYKKYLKDPSNHKTSITVEVDGLTNGAFFTLINYLGSKSIVKKFMNALGIYDKSSKNNSVIKHFQDKNNLDVYEMIGANFGNAIRELKNQNAKDLYRDTNKYIMSVVDTRKLAKDPVMTVFYMAGKSKIAQKVGHTIYSSLLKKLEQGDIGARDTIATILGRDYIGNNLMNTDLSKLEVVDYKDKKGNWVKTTAEKKIVQKLAKSYGEAMYMSLEMELGPLINKVKIAAEASQEAGMLKETIGSNMKLRSLIKKHMGEKGINKFDRLTTPKMAQYGVDRDTAMRSNNTMDITKSEKEYSTTHGSIKKTPLKGTKYISSYTSSTPMSVMRQDSATNLEALAEMDFGLNVFDAEIAQIDQIGKGQDKYNELGLKGIHNRTNTPRAVLETVEDTIKNIAELNRMLKELNKLEGATKDGKVHPDISKGVKALQVLMSGGHKVGESFNGDPITTKGLNTIKSNMDQLVKDVDSIYNEVFKGKDLAINQMAGMNTVYDINVEGDITKEVEPRDKTVVSDNTEVVSTDNLFEYLSDKVIDIRDTESTNKIREVVELLKDIRPNVKVEVVPRGGSYNSKTNTLQVSKKNSVVLHELVHAITSDGIMSGELDTRALDKLGKVVEASNNTSADMQYLKSIQDGSYRKDELSAEQRQDVFRAELMAVLMSNNELRAEVFSENQESLFNKIMTKIIRRFKKLAKLIGMYDDGNKSVEYADFLETFADAVELTKEYKGLADKLESPSTVDRVLKGAEVLTKPGAELLDKGNNMSLVLARMVADSTMSKNAQALVYGGYKLLEDKIPAVKVLSKWVQRIPEADFVQRVMTEIGHGKNVDHDELVRLRKIVHQRESQATVSATAIVSELQHKLKAANISKEEAVELNEGIVMTEMVLMYDDGVHQTKLEEYLKTGDKAIIQEYRDAIKESHIELDDRIEAMVEFMLTGTSKDKGYLVTKNATQLAKSIGLGNNVEFIDAVDRYATMRAIEVSGKRELINRLPKELLQNIMYKQMSGMAIQADLFGGREVANRIKGYFHQDMSSSIEPKWVNTNELDVYLNSGQGWKRTKVRNSKGALLVRDTVTPRLISGILVPGSQKHRGNSIEGSEGVKPEDAKKMYGLTAIPRYDLDGEIIDWTYNMSYENKREILKLEDSIDLSVGKTLGSLMRKSASGLINQEVLDPKGKNTMYVTIRGDKVAEVVDKVNTIEQLKADKPMFLSIPESVVLSDDPTHPSHKYILENYKKIDFDKTPLSKEFKGKGVNYIKKGVEDEVLGYREKFFFENREARMFEAMYKGYVSQFKQNVVLKSPVVHAGNFASNAFILGINGIGIVKQAQYFKEFLNNHGQLRDLIHKKYLLQLELQGSTGIRKTNIEKKLDTVKKEIDKNPVSEAYEEGFIQTITNEMTAEGMYSNDFFMEKAEELINNIGGNKQSKIAEGFKKFAEKSSKWKNRKTKGVRDKKSEDSIDRAFNNFLDDVKDIDGTVADALSLLYMGSDSASGKLLANMMQVSDQMSRWAMYKGLQERVNHKTGKKYTKSEASQMALDSFVDYRKNLTRELKVVSDYAMVPFVTFWLRIQKVLWGLIANNPLRALLYGSLVHGGANTFNTSVLNLSGTDSRVNIAPPDMLSAMVPGVYADILK